MNKMTNKQNKYTCYCCGYKSLLENCEGEICPICFWEVEYFYGDDLLCFSNANHMTLYEAQENYVKMGCSKEKLLKHCRQPDYNEEKDKDWKFIQTTIEIRFNNTLQLQVEIARLSELLMKPDSKILFDNFCILTEINIMYDYEDLWRNNIEFREDYSRAERQNELLLKALVIKLAKYNIELLLDHIEEYYKKGVCYYITWVIMLMVVIVSNQYKLSQSIIDILIEVELNNYFGLKSLEQKIKDYWLNYKPG